MGTPLHQSEQRMNERTELLLALHRAQTNWNAQRDHKDLDKAIEAEHYERCIHQVIALIELVWPK